MHTIATLQAHSFSRFWWQLKLIYWVWKNHLIESIFFIILGSVLPFITLAVCPPDCTFVNPAGDSTFLDFIKRVAQDVRNVAVPFAVIAIIFVGFKFVISSSSGKAEETAKARRLLIWVVLGSAIIVAATVLIEVAINTMNAIQS